MSVGAVIRQHIAAQSGNAIVPPYLANAGGVNIIPAFFSIGHSGAIEQQGSDTLINNISYAKNVRSYDGSIVTIGLSEITMRGGRRIDHGDRIDYGFNNGGIQWVDSLPGGLKISPLPKISHRLQSSNKMNFSEDFNNTYWNLVGCNATIDATQQSPMDGVFMSEIESTIINSTPTIEVRNQYNPSSGIPYHYCFAKAGLGYSHIRMLANQFSNQPHAFFDLVNGTVGTTSNVATAGILPYRDGIYLCWIGWNQSGDVTGKPRVNPLQADNDITTTGIGNKMHLWSQGIINDSTNIRDYIKTTTGFGTGKTDALQFPIASNFPSHGIMVVRCSPAEVITANESFMSTGTGFWGPPLDKVGASDFRCQDSSSILTINQPYVAGDDMTIVMCYKASERRFMISKNKGTWQVKSGGNTGFPQGSGKFGIFKNSRDWDLTSFKIYQRTDSLNEMEIWVRENIFDQTDPANH